MKKGLIILYLTCLITLAFTVDGFSMPADDSNSLYFRDNYQKCLYHKQYLVFSQFTLEACVCSLPKCTQ